MALEDYRQDTMIICSRCSYCKFIPWAQVKSWRFARGCPSIDAGKFQGYSAGGRLAVALSLLEGRSSYTDRLLDVVYKCQVCGLCDTSCKICTYMEPLETMLELRAKLVEGRQLLAQHTLVIDNLRQQDNMMMKPKAERGQWSQGLPVKDLTREKAEVVFHAGCVLSFDEELWKVARTAVNLLKNFGVDVGIMGKDEACCGQKAYEIGYRGEFVKYAENNTEVWRKAGAKTVVTCCSDCYHAFKVRYAQAGLGKGIEVLHITQYLFNLIGEGKIRFTKKFPIKVTYHDPCHLGRLGEAYVPWQGVRKKIRNQITIHTPPKPIRRGAKGIYEPPREVLKSIPGLDLVEMERIREYSWCCGAGGGVREAYPDFALWTARERIEEAKSTGAEAIVTACPWCERNFMDAVNKYGEKMKVYDLLDLLQKAI